jgi:hypothetical protein
MQSSMGVCRRTVPTVRLLYTPRSFALFSDPQTVTINTVANTLPRVSVGDRRASYVKDDETVTLSIAHAATNKGRVRRQVRLDLKKMASDPFIAGNQREVSCSIYLVIDEPDDAVFTNTELLNNSKGLLGWLSDANVTKVIAGES